MSLENISEELVKLIEAYDKTFIGQDHQISPEIFFKNYLCEHNNPFLIEYQNEIVKIFYEICNLRIFLNEICKNEKFSNSTENLIFLYLLLFYVTPKKMKKPIKLLGNPIKKEFIKKLLKILKNEITLRNVIEKACEESEISFEKRDYISKEIMKRNDTLKNVAKILEKCLKKSRNGDKREDQRDCVLKSYSAEEKEKQCPLTVLTSVVPVCCSNSTLEKPPTSNGINNYRSEPKDSSEVRKCPEIKQTVTQILREGTLIKKTVENTRKMIKDLCSGVADPLRIDEFLKELQEKKIEEELRDIERKHLLGKISLEEAKIAKMVVQKRNQEKVAEMKRQNQNLEARIEAFRKQERERIREIAYNRKLQHQELILKMKTSIDQFRNETKQKTQKKDSNLLINKKIFQPTPDIIQLRKKLEQKKREAAMFQGV